MRRPPTVIVILRLLPSSIHPCGTSFRIVHTSEGSGTDDCSGRRTIGNENEKLSIFGSDWLENETKQHTWDFVTTGC